MSNSNDITNAICDATEITSFQDGDYVAVVRQASGQRQLRKTKKSALVPLEVGLGDVTGPTSATDNHLAVFDGVTGKLIKDGGAVLTALGKATGAEVDAGTDDAKYVTPKAIADSSLRSAASGTFTTVDAKTVTVVNGVITNIT